MDVDERINMKWTEEWGAVESSAQKWIELEGS